LVYGPGVFGVLLNQIGKEPRGLLNQNGIILVQPAFPAIRTLQAEPTLLLKQDFEDHPFQLEKKLPVALPVPEPGIGLT
jgi:hypothetical protein